MVFYLKDLAATLRSILETVRTRATRPALDSDFGGDLGLAFDAMFGGDEPTS